jgi:hypothetical protein
MARVYRVLGVRGHRRRGRGVPSAGAGLDHLAGQQARQPAGAGGDMRRGDLLPHPRMPAIYLCLLPASAPLPGRFTSAHAPWDRWVLVFGLQPAPLRLSSGPPVHLGWVVMLPATARSAPCRAPGAVFAVYPIPVHPPAHLARLLAPWQRAREGPVRGLSQWSVVIVCVLPSRHGQRCVRQRLGRDAIACAPPAGLPMHYAASATVSRRITSRAARASRGDRLRRRLTTVTQTPCAARCAASSANR